MNEEQVKGAIRWAIATFGPIIASHGYASSSTIEVIGGILISAVPFIWTMMTHTQANAVAVVATIAEDPKSAVKGVIVTNTPDGNQMSSASTVVIPEGTNAAVTLAKAGV